MTAEDRRDILTPSLVLALAFMLRAAYLFFLQQHYLFFDHPSSDVLYYRHWAHQIATGSVERGDVFWGLPLYPYVLATLERMTFGNLTVMRLLYLSLGSINCLLVYKLAGNIFSRQTAIIAAVLACANFTLIYYDWLMMPVTLLIFLSLVLLLALLEMPESPPKRQWFFLGLLIGIAATGDGKFLIFYALLCAYLLIQNRSRWRVFLKDIGIPLTVGVCAVLLTITARNKLVGGDWVFVTAQSGLSFYIGNNPSATGVFENPDFIRPTHAGQDQDQRITAEQRTGRPLSPGEVSAFWRAQAFNFIINHPLDYARLLGSKAVLFLSENEAAHDIDLILQRKWKTKLDLNPFFLVCPLALLGMILAFPMRKTRSLGLFVLSQFIFTLIFFLITRHRSSILPFLLIFESYALLWFCSKLRTRDLKPALTALASIGIFIFLFRPVSLAQDSIDFLYASKAGAVYEKRGDPPKAQAEYRRALQLRPRDSSLWYNLGNTYVSEKNYREAIPYYQRAIMLNPRQPDALYNLAYAFTESGHLTGAITTYESVIQLDPGAIDAQYQLAQIYLSRHDCAKANEYLAAVLRARPGLKSVIRPRMKNCQPPDSSDPTR